jgi:hypothetical protein
MESILGTDAYSAFTPGSKEMQDAIEKDFETWMQSVEKTATEWYNTTMGYINDLISAYVELANAKAEAAKEATEAAQEEYERKKSGVQQKESFVVDEFFEAALRRSFEELN